MEMSEEYKAALRDLMRRKGRPIRRRSEPQWPEFHVSTYGWLDYAALVHAGYEGCGWLVEPGAVLVEQAYSQFTDTDHDNESEVGINVGPVRCTCGKYTDVTLRYVGSLGEILRDLLGPKTTPTITL